MDQMMKNDRRNAMRKNGKNDHDSIAEYLIRQRLLKNKLRLYEH
jgi:hypothetical protein